MKTLKQILLADDIEASIRKNLNSLINIIPEVKHMVGFKHNNPHHHLDVFEHTLLALTLSPKDFNIRLTLLLHDIGKPFSYQDEEVRHFKGHGAISFKMSTKILTNLKIKNKERILKQIEMHDEPMQKEQLNEDFNYCRDLFIIQYCDAFAHEPTKLQKRSNYLYNFLSDMKSYAKANNIVLNLPENINKWYKGENLK